MHEVVDFIKNLGLVDTEKVFLMGESQGGLVAGLTASERQEEIAGLVMLYPALCIVEDAKERYGSVAQVPEVSNLFGMTIGKKYYEDIWDYDIYANLKNYSKDVLLIHGDRDNIVPIAYSQKAAEVYEQVDFYTLEGAGHGFNGSYITETNAYLLDYLNEHL